MKPDLNQFEEPRLAADVQELPLHHWASLRSELLWIYEGDVEVNVTADHRRGYWCWLLRAGAVQVSTDREICRAREGQWIVPPRGITTQVFAPGSRIVSVHFRCEWPTGENLLSGDQGLVIEAADYPQLERSANVLLRLVRRHLPTPDRQRFSLQVTSYKVFAQVQKAFARWLDSFMEFSMQRGGKLAHAGKMDPRVHRAVQYLHGFSLAEPFPVKKLQQETGLGLARLDQLCWKELGLSTRQYWTRLRVHSAMQSLEETSLSAKEIAFRVGFKQASHFTNWFRLQANSTPRDYRQKARRNRDAGDV